MESSQLACGEVRELEWNGEDLLVYRLSSGHCRATTAWCPHMKNYIPNGLAPGVPVSRLIRDDALTCPYHGWKFDGQGLCTHVPSGQRVPPKVSRGQIIMRAWAVRENNGMIQLGREISSAAP